MIFMRVRKDLMKLRGHVLSRYEGLNPSLSFMESEWFYLRDKNFIEDRNAMFSAKSIL